MTLHSARLKARFSRAGHNLVTTQPRYHVGINDPELVGLFLKSSARGSLELECRRKMSVDVCV